MLNIVEVIKYINKKHFNVGDIHYEENMHDD